MAGESSALWNSRSPVATGPTIHDMQIEACSGATVAETVPKSTMLDLRKPGGEHADGRQERAHPIHGLDARAIGEPAKPRRAESGHAEGESEEESGDHPHFTRDQVLREHDDRRKGGGEDQ